jgi:hypothetical protein
MLSCRTPLLAPLAAAVALAVGAPAADAATAPSLNYKLPTSFPRLQGMPVGIPAFPAGQACGSTFGGVAEGQARTGGIDTIVCGQGLIFVGPQSSVTSTIGPTIISANFAGTVITSSGNVAIAP